MHITLLTLAFLLAVAFSAMLSRILPAVLPRPMIQIALGAVLTLVSGEHIELDPQTFFLLFVPPLLFVDGWRIPKDRLFKDRRAVLGLALGLVFLTVVGIGYFLHWMIAGLPLAVAFAIAAVVSPTDPIAVSSIAERVAVPKRLLSLLEGESLLNDASGLVCLRFAIAAVVTGSFSLADASLSFLWIAAGGVGVGVALCWAIVWARARIAARVGEESGAGILITLLVPFAVYLAAEHIGASGILAAAAAGITMTFVMARNESQAITRVRGRAFWQMVEFTLNGVVFVLLGAQLPRILAAAPQIGERAGPYGFWLLLAYLAGLMCALLAIRFGWSWLAMQLTLFRQRRPDHPLHGTAPISSPLRIVAAMTCAGARGAITLAGVLTLPLVLADGSTPFPARDLAIFLAMGVIVLSLAIASLALPSLLQGIELPTQETATEEAERTVRIAAAQAAIAAIEDTVRDLSREQPDDQSRLDSVARRVADRYRARIDAVASSEDEPIHSSASLRTEHRLLEAGIGAERATIDRFRRQRKIDSEMAEELKRELDIASLKAARPR